MKDILSIIETLNAYMPMVLKLMPEFGALVQKLMDTITDSDIAAMQKADEDAAVRQQEAIDRAKEYEKEKS